MPSKWSMVDTSFPTFTGDEKPKEQIGQLVNYMYILVEELKYQLENLDANNWNDKALENLQADTTKDVSEQLLIIAANLTKLTSEVAAITSRLSAVESLTGRMQQIETDLSYLEQGQANHNSRLADLETNAAAAEAERSEIREQVLEVQGITDNLAAALDALEAVVVPDGNGGATIGNVGQALHLVGNVYINGTLYEQEAGT